MLKIGEKVLSRKDIYQYFGSLQQVAGLRRFTYAEGKAKGLEAVECRSGSGLRFVILIDRGMDIGLCEYQGIPKSKKQRYILKIYSKERGNRVINPD